MTTLAVRAALAADALGVPMEQVRIACRPALAHQSNHLYDVRTQGEHFILKEFRKPEEFDSSPAREFNALKRLLPLDIAPQPVAFRPAMDGHGPIVIYRFMEGSMWDRRKPGPAQLARLADCWLAAHTVTAEISWDSRGYRDHARLAERVVERFRPYIDWAEGSHPEGLAVVPLVEELVGQLRKVNAVLMEIPRVEVFCRADPRFANVIERLDGRLGLVDWEDSGLRDPAIDVADLLVHPNQEDLLTAEEWTAFLDPYYAGLAEIDSYLRERTHLCGFILPVFYFAALLNACIARAGTRGMTRWRINTMLPEERLRRMLARATAWPDGDFTSTLEAMQEYSFFPNSS